LTRIKLLKDVELYKMKFTKNTVIEVKPETARDLLLAKMATLEPTIVERKISTTIKETR
tara:strand:+ start:296 stop:472 length:177 start_codon:yes stop_codon:yes gene_type:complete